MSSEGADIMPSQTVHQILADMFDDNGDMETLIIDRAEAAIDAKFRAALGEKHGSYSHIESDNQAKGYNQCIDQALERWGEKIMLDILIRQDGNQYMCVESDFTDLASYPRERVYWGETPTLALMAYLESSDYEAGRMLDIYNKLLRQV